MSALLSPVCVAKAEIMVPERRFSTGPQNSAMGKSGNGGQIFRNS